MARADLHVHSVFSEHPSDWFLQKLGARESYTDPETVYTTARERGMDFVTITDHNRIDGALALCRNHPADTFTGVEFTTYFPEDGCKIHVLVFGLTAEQFEELNVLRQDIYRFSARLHELNLAHSVAHATYPVNRALGIGHLEKLLLLFDVFEGINGGRNAANNRAWNSVLEGLSDGWIRELEARHSIDAGCADPWIRGTTGGSDDHAGLYVGRTFTVADASSPGEFLDAVRERRSAAGGRSNDYKSLVFSVYRIAYDFARQKRSGSSRGLVAAIGDLVFERKDLKLRDRLVLRRRASGGGGRTGLYALLDELIEELGNAKETGVDERLRIVYEALTALSDEFLHIMVSSIERDIAEGDLAALVSNLSASLPGIFIYLPFFTAVREMFSNRELLDSLAVELPSGPGIRSRRRRILWFTDTLTDLNGVSVTLGRVAALSGAQSGDDGFDVMMVASLDSILPAGIPPDRVVDLPSIASFELPGYDRYRLRVPSILRSLDRIAALEPDEIYISTPGPVGLTGLLVSKLMNLRCTGFFHTDYALQATRIISDSTVTAIIEEYTRWFFGCCDEVRVPTDRYISVLAARGYSFRRVSRFDRGIDTEVFSPVGDEKNTLSARFGVPDGPVLLYTGRISREKSLDLLMDAYRSVLAGYPDVNLILAGDGPYIGELKASALGLERVIFTGAMSNELLPALYSLADVFVFPSETDTFGMSVLEAQSCGLPALVSHIGGPAEIVRDGETGHIVSEPEPSAWAAAIVRILGMKEADRVSYDRMRTMARRRVLERYDWGSNYRALFTRTDRTGSQSRGGAGSRLVIEEAPAAAGR